MEWPRGRKVGGEEDLIGGDIVGLGLNGRSVSTSSSSASSSSIGLCVGGNGDSSLMGGLGCGLCPGLNVG